MKNTASATLFALLIAAPLSGAHAEELNVSGSVSYVPTWNGHDLHPAGNALMRTHFRGIVRDDDPNSPFHLTAQDCRGTSVVTDDGNQMLSSGYCDVIDGDGDAWVFWWNVGDDARTWGIISGTGKYAGMTGSGTTEAESEHANGSFSITYEGVVDMR